MHPTLTSGPWRTRCLVLALPVAMALAACGGDADDPVTVSAEPDAVTLDWRAPVEVDVLANDRASRGALTLLSVDAPANGMAAVEGNRVRYTPQDGFFGSDRLTYTVASEDGRTTATATLDLTVQARLTLGGLITDAPLAGAAVTVQVGEEVVETVADAQGRYVVEAVSADPQAWVRVTGVGADGRVKLVSLVGELAGVAALATPESGRVDERVLATLSATHWTSAEAALRARALGGELPADADAMAASDGAVRASELVTLATVVKLLADHGASLPEGAADSFALLLDAAGTEAFVAGQVALDGGTTFAAAQAEALASAPVPAGESWPVTEARTLALTLNNPVQSGGLTFTLRPDGGATVASPGGVGEATWTADGAVLELGFTPELVADVVSFDVDPATGMQVEVTLRTVTTGVRVRNVAGGERGGSALVLVRGRTSYLTGPRAGEVVAESGDGPGYPVRWIDLAQRAGVQADELVAGRRLAGVTAEERPFPDGPRADILRIDGPGSGTFELSGKSATWSLDDGWLTVTADGVPTQRYTRLYRDPVTGIESWQAGSVPGQPDGPVVYRERTLQFVQDGLVFDADTAARRWRSEGFLLANPNQGLEPNFLIRPDGTATANGSAQTWALAADGSLELLRVRADGQWLRRWTPLSRVGPHWLVLEYVDFGFAGGGEVWRINWQRDLGPAGG